MNIIQFLKIVWARKLLILGSTVACLIGAYIITLIIPPRWEASSGVMLGLLKPDPITGEVVGGAATRSYVATQIELVTDYSVAGRVADQLGWMSDPNLIQQYQNRPKSDQRDYRHWLGQLVIDRTKAEVADGSNILEIKYDGTTANEAKLVADALRQAFLDASLAYRRDDATRSADWYAIQATKAKALLDAAQTEETNYEKANGIVMADSNTDVDTAHLRAIAAQGASASMPMAAPAATPASIQLAQIDAQIAQGSQTMGPNHPAMIQLRAMRASVAGLVAKDNAAAAHAAAAAAGAGNAAVASALASQKSRVIAQGDKLEKLTQLQAAVDLRRDQYKSASAHEAEFRQQAAAADTGMTPLDAAITPKSPKFPNMLLIIPGAIGLGLAMGVLMAVLLEMFKRRVRGIEDLQASIDAPVLALIGGPNKGRRGGGRVPKQPSGLGNLKWPRPNRGKVARA